MSRPEASLRTRGGQASTTLSDSLKLADHGLLRQPHTTFRGPLPENLTT